MSSPIVMLTLIGVLFTAGVYLVLERSLTRMLLGILILSNAVNLLVILAGGPAGNAPLFGTAPEETMSDALVQALVLTAIVISLGVTAFLLALIHRTWVLEREDDLTVDREDRQVRRRLERQEQDDEEELDTTGCESTSDTDPDEVTTGGATAGPAGPRTTTGSGQA